MNDHQREFPPLRSLQAPPSSLPQPSTSLVGRDRELAQIMALLDGAPVRLLTLTGPGGTGKTRLAISLAEQWHVAGRDTAFVALAPLGDAELVPSAVAAALGVAVRGAEPVIDAVVDFVSDRREMLLIIDNFEHVVVAADFVGELLTRAGQLRVLATSRSPLRLRGEHEHPVPPLALPGAGEGTDAGEPASAAVELLVERVRAVRPGFAVDASNAETLAQICRRLDGLPLAIELAANRFRMLSPTAVLSRLEHSLTLLTRGPRDQSSRQQTLRATIDWSYGLLGETEQRSLRDFSAFAGGASLTAAESVCRADVDVLSALAESSLLRLEDESDGEPRLTMLETIREYALEKLSRSGDESAVRQHHADYYVTFAETAHSRLWGPEMERWLDLLEREHDNCRGALAWAIDVGDAEVAVGLAGALGEFWDVRGYAPEGRDWLRSALALAPEASPQRRARALFAAGKLATNAGDLTAATAPLAASAALFESVGDVAGQVRALSIQAGTLSDPALARPIEERALALARAHGDPWALSTALNNVAGSLSEEPALSLYQESLALRRALGYSHAIAMTLGNIGEVALILGKTETAAAHIDEALTLARKINYRGILATSSFHAGIMALDDSRLAHAARRFTETLQVGRDTASRPQLVEGLMGLAGVAAAAARDADAIRLWTAANAIGRPQSDASVLLEQRYLSAIRARSSPASIEQLESEGRALTREQAIELALDVAREAGGNNVVDSAGQSAGMEFEPGRSVGGYRLGALLGRGGMGAVYRAVHTALDRPVALKVIRAEHAGVEAFRARFRREARLAASLEHPHVVPVFDAGEEDGVLYLAMRLVEGTDLRSELRVHGRLESGRAVRVVGELASALDAAHAAGLVHRDVKPGNVLLEPLEGGGECAYLADFGLSRVASSTTLTDTGQVMGTLNYVAPEQLRGAAVDGRADVYALGCMLFELLSGQVPFVRDSDAAKVWAHMNDPPPRPSLVDSSVPLGLDAVCVRAMAKQPEERFASAGALAQAATDALRSSQAGSAPTELDA